MPHILFKKGLVIGICIIIVILGFPLSTVGNSLDKSRKNKELIDHRFYINKEKNYGRKYPENMECFFSFWKNNLYGVSFANTYTGTVVGDYGIILHTKDGGKTWVRQNVINTIQTFTISSRLLDVSFFNEDIGMAIGWDGTIIYTINGGEKWNVASSGKNIAFYSAQMLTSTIGFSAGVNTIFQPMIFRTNDCWQTYDVIIFYPEHGGSNYEADLTDIYFIDTLRGFTTARIFNGEGAICRSNDSGYNWDTIYWSNYCLNEITFPSENIGYAIGDYGQIIKTIDSGVSWNKLNSGTKKDLYSVSFPTEEIGNAVGKNGVILRTEDGGSYWFTQNSRTTENLNRVQFLDTENGFAVGDKGKILHTEDGGNSWNIITKNLNKQIDFQQYNKFLHFHFNKLLPNWNLFSL